MKVRFRHLRMCVAALAIAVLSPMQFSWADAEDTTPGDDDERPALYLKADDDCRENYAAELSAAGLDVKVREFGTLDSIARFANVPAEVEVRHLLLANGYVIANHVSPATIIEFLARKPEGRGLIGTSDCPGLAPHESMHARSTRQF